MRKSHLLMEGNFIRNQTDISHRTDVVGRHEDWGPQEKSEKFGIIGIGHGSFLTLGKSRFMLKITHCLLTSWRSRITPSNVTQHALNKKNKESRVVLSLIWHRSFTYTGSFNIFFPQFCSYVLNSVFTNIPNFPWILILICVNLRHFLNFVKKTVTKIVQYSQY